jgi:epoxide hydrolase-like predicted phosphatase
MQTLIKAVLWDIGGVLYRVDFKTVHAEASRRLNLPESTIGDLYKEHRPDFLLGRKNMSEIIRARFGTQADITGIFAQVMQEYTNFHPEVIQIVDTLRPLLVQVAFTNLSDNRESFDRKNKVFDHFDEVMLSYKIGLKKPDPAFFRYACEKLRIEPSEALLIDDRQENVAGAVAFGMKGILYQNPAQLQRDLRDLGFAV